MGIVKISDELHEKLEELVTLWSAQSTRKQSFG